MDTEYLVRAHLDGESFLIDGNQVGLLMIHGFTATTTEVRLLANEFMKDGFTILAPLLTGHGTRPAELNKTSYLDWIALIEESYQTLLSRCTSIFVAGESMGALLALHLAATQPDIAGILCYSPAITVNNLWISMVLRYFVKEIKKNRSDDDLLWKGYKVNPVRASAEMYQLQRLVKSELHNIHQPLSIFVGGLDDRISSNSGNYLLNHVSSKIKDYFLYPESPHCMILDKDLPDIAANSLLFINSITTLRSKG